MELVDLILESARATAGRIFAWLPGLLLAVVILVAGWLLARLSRFLAVRALRAVNFGVLTERAGIDAFLQRGLVKTDAVGLAGLLVYALVLVLAAIAAFESLGLPAASALLGEVVRYAPRVFVAVVVVALGAYFARFAGTASTAYFRNVGVAGAARLGWLVQAAVLVFIVVLALDELAIAGTLLRRALLLLLAGIGLAFAIAFGLGGRDWAAGWIERWRAARNRPGRRDDP